MDSETLGCVALQSVSSQAPPAPPHSPGESDASWSLRAPGRVIQSEDLGPMPSWVLALLLTSSVTVGSFVSKMVISVHSSLKIRRSDTCTVLRTLPHTLESHLKS